MAPGERRIKRTILEVGTGNVTICEVTARHDPQRFGLVVVPHTEDEVTLFVNDLCAGAVPAIDGDTGLDGERRGVPKEIGRALRNMCELSKRQDRGPDGKRAWNDPILDLAKGRSLNAVASEVFNRLRLSQRTECELSFHPSSGDEPREWLQKAYADVNDGRNARVGLPKQITVIAPLSDIAIKPYDIRMIDTRGIDEPLAERADLRAYLEDPRTIPVLCSPFAGPLASSIEQLLQGSDDTGGGTTVAVASVVLLLAKNDEAMQVRHDSGEPLESVEEGYQIRNERARDDLRRIARSAARPQPEVISFNSDTDDPNRLLDALIDRIKHVRSSHADRIEGLCGGVATLAEEATQVGVSVIYAKVYRQLQAVSVTKLRPSTGRPYERLISMVRQLHPRTVWASVVRQGSWINLDVYHYLGMGVAAEAERRTRPLVNELEAALGRMLASDEFLPVHQFLKEAIKSVGDWHSDFVQSAARLGKDAFRPPLKEATQLWSACAGLYGMPRFSRARRPQPRAVVR